MTVTFSITIKLLGCILDVKIVILTTMFTQFYSHFHKYYVIRSSIFV